MYGIFCLIILAYRNILPTCSKSREAKRHSKSREANWHNMCIIYYRLKNKGVKHERETIIKTFQGAKNTKNRMQLLWWNIEATQESI